MNMSLWYSKGNIKRYVAVAIICLLIEILIISTIGKGFISTKEAITVDLNVKIEQDVNFQLFFDDGNGENQFNETDSIISSTKKTEGFQSVTFKLPIQSTSKTVSNIRIDIGSIPGLIIIDHINFYKGDKKLYTMYADEIKKEFVNINQIDKLYIDNGKLYLYSRQIDPFLWPNDIKGILTILNNHSRYNFSLIIFGYLGLLLIISYLVFTIANGKRILDIFLIGLFIVILLLPFLSNIFDFDNMVQNSEKRVVVQRPELFINGNLNISFPREFDNYFNDSFGLRGLMVRTYNNFHSKFLNISPTDKVVMGEDGWLFYASKEDGDPIACYKGTNLFKQEELEKIKTSLEQQKDWLEKRGIPYVIIVSPNKSTIYGDEYLPPNIRKTGNASRLDQLIEYLEKNSNIVIVDVRDQLMKEKSDKLLYYKTDSHWNSYGAYIAYKALMEEVNNQLPEANYNSISDYEISTVERRGGDLAIMLDMENEFKDIEVGFSKRSGINYSIESPSNDSKLIVSQNINPRLSRAVMFRDSFGTSMVQFVSDHFSRIVYKWDHNFDMNLIETEKPDIVIHEIVERYLPQLIQENLGITTGN